MWCSQHEGVTPDVLVFAKGIASGLPLSGIMARPGSMQKSPPGSMGGTFGATAVCAAAAVATLQVVQEEGLLANAAARGAQLQAGLAAMAQRHPGLVAQVRGRGCMVGLEFNAPAGSGFAGADTGANTATGFAGTITGLYVFLGIGLILYRFCICIISCLILLLDFLDLLLDLFTYFTISFRKEERLDGFLVCLLVFLVGLTYPLGTSNMLSFFDSCPSNKLLNPIVSL